MIVLDFLNIIDAHRLRVFKRHFSEQAWRALAVVYDAILRQDAVA